MSTLTLYITVDPSQWKRMDGTEAMTAPSRVLIVARGRDGDPMRALEALAIVRLAQKSASKEPALVRSALALIERRYADRVSLCTIAARLAVPRTTLSAAFRRFRGSSVGHAIREVRVRRAMELLAKTSVPVHEIAQQTGFFDQAHLTRTFRKATGTTPVEFRRGHR